MKVLWFEVTVPGRFKDVKGYTGGWQDSLEEIVRTIPSIELSIAFEVQKGMPSKNIGNVTYHPIYVQESFLDKCYNRWSCEKHISKLIESALKLIDETKPDIIQVFGTEWLWGLIAEKINIPVVIHIQGAIIPYYNALYPPNYTAFIEYYALFPKIKRIINKILDKHRFKSSLFHEKRVWKCVNNYMGRTKWDYSLLKTLNPNAKYYHVEEAIRPAFFENTNIIWKKPVSPKIHLISTGCGSFWKGPDMLLKTAHILTKMEIDFTWTIAGGIDNDMINLIEYKENTKFSSNHVTFLGLISAQKLRELLCQSTIYVHTAYIENSPNSICEAQLLGVPIISTNVGGISTLIGENGVLVPANDPWQMAYAIVELNNDYERMISYSIKGREIAVKRHNPENIKTQLLHCYNEITNGSKE